MAKIKNRLGEKGINNQGLEMEIVEFNNSHDLVVKIIKYNELIHTQYHLFKNGIVHSNFFPSVYGVGYIGNAFTKDINGNTKKSYNTWIKMLARCYSDDRLKRYPAYKDCKVCEEWHSYENYEKWFNDNYYEIDGIKMEIDKDILFKNNKVYSPNNCLVVPSEINNLFEKSKNVRGEYPIGVYYQKKNKPGKQYCSKISINGKNKYIGSFCSPEEAFNAYKIEKENYIKKVADKYKHQITDKLYKALYDYVVDIDD